MALEIVIGKDPRPARARRPRKPMTLSRALTLGAAIFLSTTVALGIIFAIAPDPQGALAILVAAVLAVGCGGVFWVYLRLVRDSWQKGIAALRGGEFARLYLAETADLWALDSAQFGQVVTRMLARMGYAVQRTPGGLDGAPPLTANAHLAGDLKYYHVQPVHQAEVDVDAVTCLHRYLEQQTSFHVGVLVASGFFTDEAKAAAGERVKLIDGDAVMANLKEQPRPFGV